jgi:hypothetical protein
LEERKKQMAQLVEMGVAIPEEFRREMALAGEWQTVSQRVITPQEEDEKGEIGSSALNIGVRKRKQEEKSDDEEAEQAQERPAVRKGWGRYASADDDDDLDALFAKTKDIKRKGPDVKTEVKSEETESQPQSEDASPAPGPVPGASIKKEESAEGDLSTIPPPDSNTQGGVPGVVFKKRKHKALKK